MNGWEPTTAHSWGGRPVARRVVDSRARHRVVVSGEVVDAKRCVWRGSCAHRFRIDDGTGQLAIVFGGAQSVPGMVEGVRCTVEGTALADEEGIVLWNPLYRFELADTAPLTLVKGHAVRS